MRKNFNHPLLDLKENEITGSAIGELCVQALMNLAEGENPTSDEKVQRFKLATKISVNLVGKSEDVELTVEEASLLKQVVGKMFTPLGVGRIYEFLES